MNRQVEDMCRKGMGKPSPRTLLSVPPCVQQPDIFLNPFCLFVCFFLEVSLHRQDWLNQWSLVIEFSRQPLSPSREAEKAETESSKPIVTWLVPLATSPHS